MRLEIYRVTGSIPFKTKERMTLWQLCARNSVVKVVTTHARERT
jgi:hypothetical protein